MTDKLQDVVEKWIAEKQFSVLETGKRVSECKSMCIEVTDLRAFLAQYVLCEKASAVTVILPEPDGDEYPEPDLDVSMQGLEVMQQSYPYLLVEVRIPLHAPAKEVNSEG